MSHRWHAHFCRARCCTATLHIEQYAPHNVYYHSSSSQLAEFLAHMIRATSLESRRRRSRAYIVLTATFE
jgi:hypothetical protein